MYTQTIRATLSHLFIASTCLGVALGCQEALPQAEFEDVREPSLLEQLGVSVRSLEVETNGDCRCNGVWEDRNGNSIEDPGELPEGFVEPQAFAHLILKADRPTTIRIRMRSVALELGGDIHRDLYDGSELPFEERVMLVTDDAPATESFSLRPDNIPVGVPGGPHVLLIAFDVTGPDGETGVLRFRKPFYTGHSRFDLRDPWARGTAAPSP